MKELCLADLSFLNDMLIYAPVPPNDFELRMIFMHENYPISALFQYLHDGYLSILCGTNGIVILFSILKWYEILHLQ